MVVSDLPNSRHILYSAAGHAAGYPSFLRKRRVATGEVVLALRRLLREKFARALGNACPTLPNVAQRCPNLPSVHFIDLSATGLLDFRLSVAQVAHAPGL